jgi:hypothetical protein
MWEILGEDNKDAVEKVAINHGRILFGCHGKARTSLDFVFRIN